MNSEAFALDSFFGMPKSEVAVGATVQAHAVFILGQAAPQAARSTRVLNTSEPKDL